ncbi:MAG: DUF1538 domain-containing protein [Candidatus Thiothrix putei]|uniref:DUF1538 domain-containing protein n=1 Tax=Candidatus Thiothrix putei TaxID=3080811 RepID=A0AA95KIY8_9GAMM|nr:MAG: DUF1538 domain-containing protein [Candidatus Thiothrix putei]
MPTEIRFGAFVREITLQQQQISYNNLTPKVWHAADGSEIPYRAPKIHLRWIDAYRLIQPYISSRLMEQMQAVVPLALYLVLFQIFVLQQGVADAGLITGGLVAVILGLMFFMEGLKVGLMPFGETLGNTLPAKATLPVVLSIVFLLGIGVTFAEPAIGALKAAGQIVQVESAPYLYAMLNEWAEVLVLGVGIGVGAAAILGTLRLLNGWSLKPLIYLSLIPIIALTVFMQFDPELSKTLGLAWDSGAVTTGPVTVPLVLALGIGIAAAAGKGQSSLSGFGIVTLASLFPILSVQLLALYLAFTTTPAGIIAAAAHAQQALEPAWYSQTPWLEIIAGLRAIVPLVLFLLLVMWVILKEKLPEPGQITYGIALAVIGMIMFNLGLSYGLAKLGGQAGSLIPAAFTAIEAVTHSPLYSAILGLSLALLFAWLLGFGATLAEPALNALGLTVETLTNGAFRKSVLMYAVSFGVAFGIALGVAKIIFGFPLAWLLIPGYLLAVILTHLSSEEFVNIAWDSAGVTTGPVTVPLVLAMGLGVGNAVDAIEGFGILSMASICPIISVMLTGLWIRWKVNRKQRYYDQAPKHASTQGKPA